MGRFGRGEGNDGVGGEDWAVHGGNDGVGWPAGGKVDREDGSQNGRMAGLEPIESCERQSLERRLEACADESIDNEIGFQGGFVPGQILCRGDNVDETVCGAGQFEPGFGSIAGELVGRA